MNETFLRYFEDELRHIRETAAEFGALHPLVAGHLRLRADGCDDPFVERLLEGFAYLSARVHQKLDSDFPVFIQGLLETVYPSLLCPTPSMGIVEIEPDPSLTGPLSVPKGTMLTGHLGPGSDTRCEFRTCHSLIVHPLRLDCSESGGARYFDRDLDRLRLPRGLPVLSAMRLRLDLSQDAGTFADYADLDDLVFFVKGGVSQGGRIMEELFSHANYVVIKPSDEATSSDHVARLGEPRGVAIEIVGLDSAESILPCEGRTFEGYRNLREFLAMPERLLFFRLRGLRRLLARCKSNRIDLIIGFDRSNAEMGKWISAGTFALNATPVINLVERRVDQVEVRGDSAEYHVVVDRTKPLHYEVFSILSVTGIRFGQQERQEFQPFFRCAGTQPGARAFYTVRRDSRHRTGREERYGRVSNYAGSEIFLSIVDGMSAPYDASIDALSIRALCSNRHLPLSMPLQGVDTDLLPESGVALSSVRWRVYPTKPLDSQVSGSDSWKFLSQLSLNYLSLVEDGGAGVAALREMVRIHASEAHGEGHGWIDGIETVSSTPVVRRMAGAGPVAFQRGLDVSLTFDERHFAGASAFLFGTVLARFLSGHVTINSFVQTTLKSKTRGRLMVWPPFAGCHSLL